MHSSFFPLIYPPFLSYSFPHSLPHSVSLPLILSFSLLISLLISLSHYLSLSHSLLISQSLPPSLYLSLTLSVFLSLSHSLCLFNSLSLPHFLSFTFSLFCFVLTEILPSSSLQKLLFDDLRNEDEDKFELDIKDNVTVLTENNSAVESDSAAIGLALVDSLYSYHKRLAEVFQFFDSNNR